MIRLLFNVFGDVITSSRCSIWLPDCKQFILPCNNVPWLLSFAITFVPTSAVILHSAVWWPIGIRLGNSHFLCNIFYCHKTDWLLQVSYVLSLNHGVYIIEKGYKKTVCPDGNYFHQNKLFFIFTLIIFSEHSYFLRKSQTTPKRKHSRPGQDLWLYLIYWQIPDCWQVINQRFSWYPDIG